MKRNLLVSIIFSAFLVYTLVVFIVAELYRSLWFLNWMSLDDKDCVVSTSDGVTPFDIPHWFMTHIAPDAWNQSQVLSFYSVCL
jgi:hypothetical protein